MKAARDGDAKQVRTRRELLAGAAGALGVVAAESLARMPSAQATQGQAVIAGAFNGADHKTTLQLNNSNVTFPGDSGFVVEVDPGITGPAIEAHGGNSNTSGSGVSGFGGSGQFGGVGLRGAGGNSSLGGIAGAEGVLGFGGAPDGIGVHGYGSDAGPGILGTGGITNGNGVVGQGAGTGVGVQGIGGPSNGHGVKGAAVGAGVGVWGENDGASGFGVVGASSSGTGVHAQSSSGTALEVQGRVLFSQAGVASVSAGKSTKVTLDETKFLGNSSFILATLQQLRAGVSVSAVVPDVAGHSFTIYLNKGVSQATKIGWFIIDSPVTIV